jgi:colanic acid biosynthesis glycosyl transferase WcaI
MGRLISYLSFTATGLLGALRGRRPDVLFVESPPLFLGVAGWLAAKRFGSSFVLNVSDLWPDSVRDLGLMSGGPWLGLAERLERWLYRRATAVTAVTDGIRTRLVSDKGVPENRVLFLPNGADTVRFRPIDSSEADAPGARPTFVYAGNHGLAQGLDVVVDAADLAPEVDFVMVGDGSDKGRLEDIVAQRGLPNIRFEAPVAADEISVLYGQAAAGIASLRRSDLMEGARPAKILAIMACGRPVLYVGAGEGAELVRVADAGIVVAPEDPAALAHAARAIVADPDRAAAMGRNGRRYVEKHLSWRMLVTAWLDQLDAVLRHRSSQ